MVWPNAKLEAESLSGGRSEATEAAHGGKGTGSQKGQSGAKWCDKTLPNHHVAGAVAKILVFVKWEALITLRNRKSQCI